MEEQNLFQERPRPSFNCGVSTTTSPLPTTPTDQRAEPVVKQAKRIIKENVDGSRLLSNDKFSRVIVHFRNTPLRDFKLSPAQMFFNRKLTNHLPILPGKYKPRGSGSHIGEKGTYPG